MKIVLTTVVNLDVMLVSEGVSCLLRLLRVLFVQTHMSKHRGDTRHFGAEEAREEHREVRLAAPCRRDPFFCPTFSMAAQRIGSAC